MPCRPSICCRLRRGQRECRGPRAAVWPCVAPGSAFEPQSRCPGRIGEDLHLHPMVPLLPGVVRPVAAMRSIGSTVPSRITYALFRTASMACSSVARGRPGGRRPRVLPVDRRAPDAKTCCETGVGVASTQVRQDGQGLPTTSQATPPGADPTTATCEETVEVADW